VPLEILAFIRCQVYNGIHYQPSPTNMTSTKDIAAVTTVLIETLEPLTPDERRRAISASLTLLGDSAAPSTDTRSQQEDDVSGGNSLLPGKAKNWQKQNGLTDTQLEQVFHFDNGKVSVIAAVIPGNNKKTRTINAYILTGITRFLETGDSRFDDQAARDLCISSGCYDGTNHAYNLKGKENNFTGSKSQGWTLTSPGLRRGAELVKEIATGTE
jgi:hypothetical protein